MPDDLQPGETPITPRTDEPRKGGWWGLKSIVDASRQDAEIYNQMPPDACPIDGSVLDIGKNGVRNCPMGNYTWNGGPRQT